MLSQQQQQDPVETYRRGLCIHSPPTTTGVFKKSYKGYTISFSKEYLTWLCQHYNGFEVLLKYLLITIQNAINSNPIFKERLQGKLALTG